MSSLALPGRAERHSAPVLVALAFFASLVVLTAWVDDDCFFTLRTVDNFLRGHGPVWNPAERVQAYTHPLWMLVLTGAIGLTGEVYLTTIGCSIAASLGACVLLLRSSVTSPVAVLVLVLALLSRSFVDYSTSGLENALSYLLFALFFRRAIRPVEDARALFRLALIASLAAVARLDTLLIYVPAVTWHAWRVIGPARRPAAFARVLGALALGFGPLFLWEAFSFLYYGFPFPNTAYAKLGAGIPRGELLGQGLWYLRSSLAMDPVTLTTIAAACVLALRSGRRELLPFAAGSVLYCGYAASVGGCFMAGRFLALPFFVALAVIGQHPLRWRKGLVALPLAAFAMALFVHRVDLALDDSWVPADGYVDARGIADERLFYYPNTGLLRSSARFRPPVLRSARELAPHLVFTWAGSTGYAAGPGMHVLEGYGLSDALLARLPARYRVDWRIGHFKRVVPAGYDETLSCGENRLVDRRLRIYYDHLSEVIRGPLFTRSRLWRIIDFNLGRYDDLVDDARYRYPLLRRLDLVEGDAGAWSFAEPIERLPLEGIRLEAPRPFRVGEVVLDATGRLGRLRLLSGESVVWEHDFTGGDTGYWDLRVLAPAFASQRVTVGDATATALWILPIGNKTELSRVVVRPPSSSAATLDARLSVVR